ncbi:MAG: two-component system response regulator [Thermodesulfobacteriota bacterium]
MNNARRRILIVDDMPSNIKILNDILREDYAVSVAINGAEALEIVRGPARPDLILLDIMMPEMDGYEVCRRLKDDPETREIPILFVTAMGDVEDETRGLELGGVDYITKPVSPPIVRARVNNHIRLKLHQDHLEELVWVRTRELAVTQDATIRSLASLAETRDNETGGHILRTQRYVRALAEHLRSRGNFLSLLDDRYIDLLFKSAPLHDVGKVGVPDAILLKPGRLTGEEFAQMKKHTTLGRDAIRRAEDRLEGDTGSSFLRLAREIAYTHHEKWDGSGYPEGLFREDIPVSGRLMAVADVYDALVTRRVYKPAFAHNRAVAIIEDGLGSHFDPDVCRGFLEIEDTFRNIALEFSDCEEDRAALLSGDD